MRVTAPCGTPASTKRPTASVVELRVPSVTVTLGNGLAPERTVPQINDSPGASGPRFKLATSREPSERETTILRRVLEQQLARFQAQPTNSEKLLAVGDSARDERLVPNELAAYTIVASVILNLDEVVTKN